MKQLLLFVLFVFGILYFRECAEATYSEEKFACHGTAKNCSYLNLTCPNSRTGLILDARYGFQPKTANCPSNVTTSCDNTTCCSPLANACYDKFSESDFNNLYWQCWKQSCIEYQVPRGAYCSDSSNDFSGFVLLRHACFEGVHITDIYNNETISGSLLAVRYNSSDKNYSPYKEWKCRATLSENSSNTVNITMVRETNPKNNENNQKCSNLAVDDETPFSCNSTKVTYYLIKKSSNFRINLYIEHGNVFPVGWIVMQAPNGTSLTVKCGEHCASNMKNCTDDESPSTMGTTLTNSATTPSMATSTVMSSAATSLTSHTDTVATTAPASTHTTVAAHQNSDVGAVAGGVTAAVLVLVVVIVGVLCFVRRRRQQQHETKSPKNGTSSRHLPLTPLQSSSSPGPYPPQPGTGGKREHVTSDLPGKSHDYFVVEPQSSANGHAPEALGLDYDKLGQKKSKRSSSNPAAPYGRLGEVGGGGEDTDYNYDHLAKGRQAAPDVIDSDYNTPGLMSEGDYNVAGIPKKQHVITGSDYDVAQIVTSEGDYNRVDFQGKKQHVITGSDYDTAEIVTSEGDYNKVDFQGKKQRVITGSDYNELDC